MVAVVHPDGTALATSGSRDVRSTEHLDRAQDGPFAEEGARQLIGYYSREIETATSNGNFDLLAPGVARMQLSDDLNTSTVRHITFFQPLTRDGRIWLPGVDQVLAVMFAAYHFNNRVSAIVPQINDLSCDIRLSVEVIDTEFSPLVTCRRLLQDVLPRKEESASPSEVREYPFALIGAYRSSVSTQVAAIAGIHNLTQVAYGSAAESLDFKEKYPFFGRTIVGAGGIARVTAKYFAHPLEATHVFCVYVRDVFGIDFHSAFVQRATELNIITQSASLSSDCSECQANEIDAALDVLESSGYRYVYAILSSTQYKTIMPKALERDLAGSNYFWLFDDTFVPQPLEANDPLLRATHGSAVLTFAEDAKLEANEPYLNEWNMFMTTSEARATLTDILPSHVRDQFKFANYTVPSFPDRTLFTYDAFMSLALAACDAHDKDGVIFKADTFHSSFLDSNFDGATHVVRFDKKTGTRTTDTMTFGMSNYLADSPPDENGKVTLRSQRTHEYMLNSDGLSATWQPLETAFVYADNSTTRPPALPPGSATFDEIETWAMILGFLTAVFIVLVSLSFALWVQRHNKAPPIRATQPFFVWMLTIGTGMMGWSLVLYGIIPVTTYPDAACNSIAWLLSIGYSVAFAAIYSKLMRFHEIHRSSQEMKRVAIKPIHVLRPFLILLSLNLLVLVTWLTFSPLHYEKVGQDDYDRFGRPTSFTYSCSSEGASYYRITLGLIDIAALISAAIQSYRVRNIGMLYEENHHIWMALLISSQSYLIGIPAVMAVAGNPSAECFCRSVAVLWGCLGLLLPIGLPKLRQLHEWRVEKVRMDQKRAERKRRADEFFEFARLPDTSRGLGDSMSAISYGQSNNGLGDSMPAISYGKRNAAFGDTMSAISFGQRNNASLRRNVV